MIIYNSNHHLTLWNSIWQILYQAILRSWAEGCFWSPYQRMRWKRDFMLGRTWICSEIPSFSASQFNRKDTIFRLRTSCIRLAICQVNKGLDVNLLFQTFWLTNIYRTMPQKPKTYRDGNQQTYFVKNIPLYLTKKIFHNTQVRFNPVHDSKPQSILSSEYHREFTWVTLPHLSLFSAGLGSRWVGRTPSGETFVEKSLRAAHCGRGRMSGSGAAGTEGRRPADGTLHLSRAPSPSRAWDEGSNPLFMCRDWWAWQ